MNGDFSLAVHALVYIYHKQKPQDSEELAVNICTNPARVRRVMARLAAAGLVRPLRGGHGGYALPESAAPDLATVARALDARPVQVVWRSGDADMDCRVASGMAALMDGIYQQMNDIDMDYLSGISIADINAQLFGAEAGKG